MMVEERNRVVEDNLNLVRFVLNSGRVAIAPDDYDDLFQVGCIGLIEAAERFDENRGVKFSTFAVLYIQGHIQRYKIQYSERFHGLTGLSGKVKKYNSDVYNGNIDKNVNMADAIGLATASLQSSIGDKDDSWLEDYVSNRIDPIEGFLDKLLIEEVFEEAIRLVKNDSRMIALLIAIKERLNRDGGKPTQEQIAKMFGVSQVTACRSLKKLRLALTPLRRKVFD